ncbi:MAG: hypothetical protein HY765_06925, partial [Rhodomicrobium sp.]|nr:hypothetical protein [Rhodomicrobium sp.]
MIRRLIIALAAMAAASAATGPLHAEQQPAGAQGTAPLTAQEPIPSKSEAGPPMTSPPVAAPATATPEAEALRKALTGLAAGDSNEERNEHAALLSFYEMRGYAPLWLTPSGGLTPQASLVAAEIKRAGEWGLDPRDFPLPS